MESFELRSKPLLASFATAVIIVFILVLLLDFIGLQSAFICVPYLSTFVPQQGSDLFSPYSQG